MSAVSSIGEVLCFDGELVRMGTVGGASGLQEQIARLFLKLRDPVYRYLLAMLRNREICEDLTQETFLRLFMEVRRGGSVTNVRAWVFRVAHNLAMDQQRKRRDSPLDEDVDLDDGKSSAQDPTLNAEEWVVRMEKHKRVRCALVSLSSQERQCLNLRAEGLRYREIAGVLGIRVSTVETFLSRAIAKIAARVHD